MNANDVGAHRLLGRRYAAQEIKGGKGTEERANLDSYFWELLKYVADGVRNVGFERRANFTPSQRGAVPARANFHARLHTILRGRGTWVDKPSD